MKPVGLDRFTFPKLDTQISKDYSLNSRGKWEEGYRGLFYEPV